ncbi:MAG: GtrA family protein [Clostridia bacterium]|nr:GtrA family protein [Clostridia bacterium]
MIAKLKSLVARHHEVIVYLIFGVLTTVVGWGVYYAVLFGGRAMLEIPATEVTGARYLALYTVAQIIQWVCAVLFAFFTNKKWVFTNADPSTSIPRQLLTFSAGRLVTLGLDYVITFGLTLLLGVMLPQLREVAALGRVWNACEIASKLVAAVVVIVCNYIISKLLVFRRK